MAVGPVFAVQAYAMGLGWLDVLLVRFVSAAIVSLAIVLARPRERGTLASLGPRHLAVLIGLGLFFTSTAATYYMSLERLPASLAVLLAFVSPVVIGVVSARFGRPLEGRRAWGGLGLAILGVILIIGSPGAGADAIGVALAFLSSALHSAWALLVARQGGERRLGRVAGVDAGAAVTVMLAGTAAGLVGMRALAAGTQAPAGAISEAVPMLVLFGVITTISIRSWYGATQRLGVASVSVITLVEPVITVVLAIALLGETPTLGQLLGMPLVMLAVYLAIPRQDARPSLLPTGAPPSS
jgi:drug/metabolite transporter (DMT)-like permease